jgi:hypothetical protein
MQIDIRSLRLMNLMALAICVLASTAQAQRVDTVTLANGDHFNAKIKSIVCESRSLIFNLDQMGTATIRWDGIASLTVGDVTLTTEMIRNRQLRSGVINHLMLFVNLSQTVAADRSEAKPVSLDGSLESVFSAVCEQRRLSTTTEETSASKPFDPAPLSVQTSPTNESLWRGKLESSSALTIGTQTQETLSGRLALSYERNTLMDSWLKHTVSPFDIEAAYGNSAKKGSARTMTNQISYGSFTQSFVKYRSTIFTFGSLYHNFSQAMKLEQEYGLGMKYSLRRSKTAIDAKRDEATKESIPQQLHHNIVVAADIRALHENFGRFANSFSSAAAGLQFDDSVNAVISSKLTLILDQHIELVPAFKSNKAFQARAASSLTIPITSRFNVGFQFNDFYVRNAPPNHRQNYSKTTFSFGYVLGKIK